jgi:hypothetical protein
MRLPALMKQLVFAPYISVLPECFSTARDFAGQMTR